MKIFSCVVTMEIEDETSEHPAKRLGKQRVETWPWDELLGRGPHPIVRAVTVYDVTDEPIERVRLTAEGVVEI